MLAPVLRWIAVWSRMMPSHDTPAPRVVASATTQTMLDASAPPARVSWTPVETTSWPVIWKIHAGGRRFEEC